jgi:nucleoside-diphosphate-sugar epimerase
MSECYVITGAFGCIGARTIKRLVDEGLPVWTHDLPGNPHRLRLIMDEAALARANFVNGDIDSSVLDQDLGPNHWMPLANGVQQTIGLFQTAVKAGKLDAEKALE